MESNKTEVFPVIGMHCASCATIIKKNILKVPGTSDCSVNPATEKATITYDPSIANIDKFNGALSKLGYRFEQTQSKKEDTGAAPSEHEGHHNHSEHLESLKAETSFIFPVSLFVFLVMMWDIAATQFTLVPPLPFPMKLFNLFMFLLSGFAIFGIGRTFTDAVWRFLLYRKANMDTLIGIGTLTAFIYSSFVYLFPRFSQGIGFPESLYFDVVIVVIGFIKLGKYLEARSKQKTGEALEKLMHLQAKTALIERDGKEIEIPIEDLKEGDVYIVKPGSTIPTDGLVVKGASSVNESIITGESLPVDKKIKDTVTGGTINEDGVMYCRATKIGKDTVLSQIIDMVDKAQNSRAPIERLVDQISSVFVPVVLVIALATFAVWVLFGSRYMPISEAFIYGLTAFVGILVIACPCALGLATPTAMVVAMGKGASHGILVKNAESLEKLEKVDTVVMDKTGTLTEGKPVVTDIVPIGKTKKEDLLKIAASLEKSSEHPLAKAITLKAEELKLNLENTSNFRNLKGMGVSAKLSGKDYWLGNLTLLEEMSIKIDRKDIEKYTNQGKTPVFLLEGDNYLGAIYIADTLKNNAKSAVVELQDMNVKTVMLTGDDTNTAKFIAKKAGIVQVIGRVLPSQKADHVGKLQTDKHVVAMVGDGVNDAPALATADVGIAMSTGTDVAMSTAHITLLHGDISKVAKSINLSRKTMSIVRQNLFWAFIYNIIGIPLAAGILYPITGTLLNPVFAGLAMALSSVSVVTNSLRLKTIKI